MTSAGISRVLVTGALSEVPADSVYVLFGITLTGPGQIWASNIQVEPA